MTRKEKTLQLRRYIRTRLGDLINRDYVLLGLPYYLNVGDILIWEGERQFFRSFRYKCLNEGYHYRNYWKINDDTLILLQGGGNFGDLWRFIQEERINICQRYKNNPIIITPVTFWYDNLDLLRHDSEILSTHPNLTICARDSFSYGMLRKYFNNRIILMPDMAFCIKRATLERYFHSKGKGTLFLKRTDKELASKVPLLPKEVQKNADVRDWPSMEKNPMCWILYRKLCNYGNKMGRYKGLRIPARIILKSTDLYFHEHCRKQLIHDGVTFVGQYSNIYTTRLHGAILSILLDKEVTIIDNSYGKNASFFETWLSDTDGVKLWRSQ